MCRVLLDDYLTIELLSLGDNKRYVYRLRKSPTKVQVGDFVLWGWIKEINEAELFCGQRPYSIRKWANHKQDLFDIIYVALLKLAHGY